MEYRAFSTASRCYRASSGGVLSHLAAIQHSFSVVLFAANYSRKSARLVMLRMLFIVYALDFENHRTGAVVTAGYHRVFVFHPAAHDGAALKTGIDIA